MMHDEARYQIAALHIQADALTRYADRVRELATHTLRIEDWLQLNQVAVEVERDIITAFDALSVAVTQYAMPE